MEQASKVDAIHPSSAEQAAIHNEYTPDDTDVGNANRYAQDHEDYLKFCYPWSSWLEFDGIRYKRDETGRHIARAESTILAMVAEARLEEDPKRKTEMRKHALNSQGVRRIEGMIKLAQNKLAIPPELFDKHPDLIATPNCIIDLRTGEMLDSKIDLRTGEVLDSKRNNLRDLLITRSTSAGHFPGTKLMECPIWNSCLEKWTDGDKELERWLQRAIGYSITGRTDEEVIFVLHGPTRSGKTKFIEAIGYALGEYSATIRPEVMMRQRVQSDRADPEISKLNGIRFVYTSEAEEGHKFAESKLKRMTGGDTISVRNVFEKSFDMKTQFKVWFSTNRQPEATTDPGFWERMIPIPFSIYIPLEERDKTLMDKLQNEEMGILKWAIDGAVMWNAEGLYPLPAVVVKARELYRDDSNPLREWLLDNVELKANAETQFNHLFQDYRGWCDSNEYEMISNKKFANVLKDLKFEDHRGTGGRHFRKGLILKSQDLLWGDDE